VIDEASRDKIVRVVDSAVAAGATVLLDGRGWAAAPGGGWWVGPTVLKLPAAMLEHECVRTEIFGPVLCVLTAADSAQALAWEALDAHGNAACIYTSSGATADFFARRFSAAMVGVNIGVPVPREPFSFGGLEGSKSKFGEHDITGDGGLHFFTKASGAEARRPRGRGAARAAGSRRRRARARPTAQSRARRLAPAAARARVTPSLCRCARSRPSGR
jgi:acyl-CoA reductase-like NAD-dependent aldehyde dehydrogenase